MTGRPYLLLFVSLLVLLLAYPFFTRGPLALGALQLLVTGVLLAAAGAVAGGTRRRRLVWILAGAALGTGWAQLLFQERALGLLGQGLSFLFFAWVTGELVAHLLRAGRATAETLFAAFSAYLLLGVVFAFVYGIVDLLAPGALAGSLDPGGGAAPGTGRFGELLYFSFVTLTTLGYGDIAPAGAGARALAPVEALLGQLYLAALVARLVGLHLLERSDARRS